MKHLAIIGSSLLAAVAATAGILRAQATRPAGGPKVEAVGLSVAKGDPADRFGGSLVVGLPAGTRLYVRLADPERFFLGLDDQAGLEAKTFADDKGTDLLKEAGRRSPLSFMADVSEDGRSVMLAVMSRQLPAQAARELKLKAGVVLLAGSQEKTAQQKDLALKEGSKVAAGPVPMTVSKVQDADWGDSKLLVEFSSERSFDAIRSIEFIGPDGKQIKSRQTGSSRMSGFGKSVYTRAFGLAAKAETVALKITYFDAIEKLPVPIDLSVGVGL